MFRRESIRDKSSLSKIFEIQQLVYLRCNCMLSNCWCGVLLPGCQQSFRLYALLNSVITQTEFSLGHIEGRDMQYWSKEKGLELELKQQEEIGHQLVDFLQLCWFSFLHHGYKNELFFQELFREKDKRPNGIVQTR